jgi:CBS domain-containing protein
MRRWLARDVMTTDVITVGELTPYKEIVDVLVTHAVSAVSVLADGGHVVGIVSEAGLLHKMEFTGVEPYAGLLERKRRRIARAKSGGDTARDLMTSPAIVVGPVESLATVAKLMDAERVKRVPVVDGHRRLVGIVSRRDLLRLYLRDDESIRTEIVQEVLLRTLWIPSGTITVAVDRGVVSLSGTVDRGSTVPLVARLVEGIAGVVDVANHLTYHFDDTTDPDRSHPAFG